MIPDVAVGIYTCECGEFTASAWTTWPSSSVTFNCPNCGKAMELMPLDGREES